MGCKQDHRNIKISSKQTSSQLSLAYDQRNTVILVLLLLSVNADIPVSSLIVTEPPSSCPLSCRETLSSSYCTCS
jgi:hypothetical protein